MDNHKHRTHCSKKKKSLATEDFRKTVAVNEILKSSIFVVHEKRHGILNISSSIPGMFCAKNM